jgi:cell division protein FtsL
MTRLNFILLAALMACALALVTSQHQARKLYVELQKEQALAQQIEVEWGQLQLEQSTWAMHARVEKLAIQALGMRVPSAGRTQVVPPVVQPVVQPAAPGGKP